jgi:hypothetical protein
MRRIVIPLLALCSLALAATALAGPVSPDNLLLHGLPRQEDRAQLSGLPQGRKEGRQGRAGELRPVPQEVIPSRSPHPPWTEGPARKAGPSRSRLAPSGARTVPPRYARAQTLRANNIHSQIK